MCLAVQPGGDFSQWLSFEQGSLVTDLNTSGKKERMGTVSNFFSLSASKLTKRDII